MCSSFEWDDHFDEERINGEKPCCQYCKFIDPYADECLIGADYGRCP